MIRFFGYLRHCLPNPIRSSFSVPEDSERKDSFELLLFRPICSYEDSSTLFLESTFLFFFLLPLFLFLTVIDSLEKVFIPTTSNCQSNFANWYKKFSCNFFLSLKLKCKLLLLQWNLGDLCLLSIKRIFLTLHSSLRKIPDIKTLFLSVLQVIAKLRIPIVISSGVSIVFKLFVLVCRMILSGFCSTVGMTKDSCP